jgi:hypothetical protein
MTPPAAAAAPAVRPRRPAAPRGPRRVSGPARPAAPQRRRARPRSTGHEAGLAVGLISALEGLAQHRLLDRLIRGRTWIGLLAFALIGIVTLQLGLLKLNGGIGRALEHEALLQRENAALSIENSELAAGSRIEARASHLGMAFAPPGSLRFLAASPGSDPAKAATAIGSSNHSSTAEARKAAGGSGEAAGGSREAAASGESRASSEAGSGEAAGSSSSSSEAESSSSGSGESTSPSAESTAAAGSPGSAESTSATSPEATPAGGIQAGSPGG